MSAQASNSSIQLRTSVAGRKDNGAEIKVLQRAPGFWETMLWFVGNNDLQMHMLQLHFFCALSDFDHCDRQMPQRERFVPLLQPCPRNQLEENEWHSFPQQSQNEEFRRHPWNTQFPAGRRRNVWMYGRESEGKKYGAGTSLIPWLVDCFKLNDKARRRRNDLVSVTDIHIRTGIMHVSSSFNCICLTGNLFVCNMHGMMLPQNYSVWILAW